MRLDDDELNRATLARQLLLDRARLPVPDAVRRVLALQAQHPASPYLALWNRVADLDPAAVDAAFADGTLVKATLLRVTLHAVHRDDHAMLHAALLPTLRDARLAHARSLRSGLTAEQADALVPGLLAHAARPRPMADLVAWVEAAVGPPEDVWWALRRYAPLRHAPSGGPWSFGARPAFVASGLPAAPADAGAVAAALATLVVRCLEAFGPASVADVARFTLVPRPRVRDAVTALGDALVRLEGPDGAVLHDVPDGLRPPAGTPAPPRLMAMWDSTLLAFDRPRVVPPAYRAAVVRTNGDVLPTLLVDGRVAGVWRSVDGGVEATSFHPLPDDAWEGLAAEARGLVALLAGREARPYGRYDHWWAKPGWPDEGEVRLLPG
ncbi:winged helix DNA-binding domain-containing protein [Actinotalea solisilvae]|uniref:winged helix DNA-binding domain-containing protein n=1 Tax=Actinotalea solisilvae TaxID=2072922 RepID=UPI0027DCA03C|nr:winged helix DNA-binding domain-containing protein [Actinotalea solisilvae]